MKTLDKNWFAEGWIDLEYKQYILLDYLQQSQTFYKEKRLYPFLSDLLSHYKNLVEYRDNMKALEESFPKKIIGVDLKNKRFIYSKTIKNKLEPLDTLNEIVDFSIPAMKRVIEQGREIYKSIEKNINFQEIGVIPQYKNEGYIMLRYNKKIYVYRFRISPIESNEKLSLFLVTSFDSTLTNTPEKVKQKLIKGRPFLPNPATYYVDIDSSAPLEETLIPIIKRVFLKEFACL